MTNGKLSAEAKRIDALSRINFFAKNVNCSHAADIYLNELFKTTESNILTPGLAYGSAP